MIKKRERRTGLEGMPFGEALERLLGVDGGEVSEEIERTRRDEEAAERYVEERRDSIKRGARRAPKRFRP